MICRLIEESTVFRQKRKPASVGWMVDLGHSQGGTALADSLSIDPKLRKSWPHIQETIIPYQQPKTYSKHLF